MRTGTFHLLDNRAFSLHLLEQDFPDQIERIEDLGIGQPVVHDIPVFAGQEHSSVFHHVQVLRKIADCDREQVCQSRDRHLLIPERVQNLQAQWMRENLAHFSVPGIDLGLWMSRPWIVSCHVLALLNSIEL
jgi:hypothetical protein